MYTLVSGYGVSLALGHGWKDIAKEDLADLPLNQIFNLYRKLYITIDSPVLTYQTYIDFDTFRTDHINDTNTLAQMLDGISDTLVGIEEIPRFESRQARYEDAFRAGYKIDVTAPYSDQSSIVAPSDKTEIKIFRPKTDMRRFYDYYMVSVNGFWHCTDTDNTNVYVLDGGRSLVKSRMNNMGIMSFEKIGKVKHIPIKAEMIYKLDDQSFYSQRAYFDLSNYDTTNKTIMAVIGGYLYLPDPAYIRQYGDNTWMVDFTGVPLLERYFEASKYLDMKDLELTKYVNNPNQLSTKEFFSDEHFTKYLTMSQSFFVIVDTPQIYTNKHFIRHTNLPGMFTMYKEPLYPLLTSNGRVSEYWKIYEDNHWSVNVHDAWWCQRQAMTIDKKDIISMTDTNIPYKTFYNSKGYMLEIGADVLVD